MPSVHDDDITPYPVGTRLNWAYDSVGSHRTIAAVLIPGMPNPTNTVIERTVNEDLLRYVNWFTGSSFVGEWRVSPADWIHGDSWIVDRDWRPYPNNCGCDECLAYDREAWLDALPPLEYAPIDNEEEPDMPARTAEHVYYTERVRDGWGDDWNHPIVADSYEQDEAWGYLHRWRRARTIEEAHEGLANVAYQMNYPSGFAALDACRAHIHRAYGYAGEFTNNQTTRAMCQGLYWPTEWITCLRDDAETYIAPHPYNEPCRCNGLHCEHCHPEGPAAAGCDCRTCRPPDFDDLGDVDDWPGIPDMPVAAEGRCRFGIELEFNSTDRYTDIRNPIAQEITRQGIACLATGYTHELARYWKMTTDGTVTGGECVSPILSGDEASIEQVRQVIRIIKEHGGCTGRNVGMHVHLDVTEFHTRELKALAKNLQRFQNFLAAFVPSHRYDGSNGCGATLMSRNQWTRIENWLNDVNVEYRNRTQSNRSGSCPVGRYVAFNFNSLLTYGTVECRLLGHTLNTIKVRTWIRVLQTIVDASRRNQIVPMRADPFAWLTEFGLEAEHAAHFAAVAEARGNEMLLGIAHPGETPSNPNYDEDEDEWVDDEPEYEDDEDDEYVS